MPTTLQELINKLRSTEMFKLPGSDTPDNKYIREKIVNDLKLLMEQIYTLNTTVDSLSSTIGSMPVRKVSAVLSISGDSMSGVTVDHFFTSAANMNKQSILMKADAALIPGKALITSVQIECLKSIDSGSAYCESGRSSGTDEYFPMNDVKTAGLISSMSAMVSPISTASGVYFSLTPTVNWNTITTGIWKVTLNYNDNS